MEKPSMDDLEVPPWIGNFGKLHIGNMFLSFSIFVSL